VQKLKTKISTNYNIESEIVHNLNNAQSRIIIICFEVSSEKIIGLLKQKSKEGVRVSIFCEERKAGADLINWNREHNENARIQFSNPNGYFHALHEKLILIDDKFAIFGSFNLSDTSLNDNIEILFETSESKLIKSIIQQISFVENVLGGDKSSVFHQNIKNKTVKKKININKIGKSILTFSNEYSFYDIICDMLSKARLSITIYASHHISDEIFNLLLNVRKRGINIKIIKDHSSLKINDLIKSKNNMINFVSVHGKMHIKAILIDSNTYIVGSVNLFERSYRQDQEFLLIGNDVNLNFSIREALDRVYKISMPVNRKLSWQIRYNYALKTVKKTYRRLLKLIFKKLRNILKINLRNTLNYFFLF